MTSSQHLPANPEPTVVASAESVPAIRRRQVLLAAGAVTVLAACGGTSDEGTLPAEPGGTGGDTADTGDDGATSAPAAGAALAATADIPVGGGIVVAQPALVITQPTAGEFRAFSSICPHQGCPVGSVADNTINCPCHGSRFDAADGAVISGPARSGLAPVAIDVEGDQIISASG